MVVSFKCYLFQARRRLEAKQFIRISNKETMLEQAVSDYLLWLVSQEYAAATIRDHKRFLKRFVSYINEQKVSWDTVFT